MKWLVVVALALTLSATGAWADRYSDCVQSKDLDRAIRGCTQVIERGEREAPKNRAVAYYNRGIAYQKKGDKDQAIADYRKALEINPSDQDAKNNLKRLGAMP